MMRTRSYVLYILIISVVTLGVFTTSGCKQVDRLVIDGETAQLMENRINDQLWDCELLLRGNTASNMHNGGYVLSDDETIWFISDMVFADGSIVHYLQKLIPEQIGSLTARNEIIAEIDELLLGEYRQHILYLDYESGYITALNLHDFTTNVIFDEPVGEAFLLENNLYATTSESGDLWKVRLDLNLSNELAGTPTLLYESAGKLMDIAEEIAYVVQESPYESVDKINLESGNLTGRIIGGYYHNVQVSGSWLFYVDGTRLMRQRLTGEPPIVASIREVEEYVVWGHWLAFTDPDSGLFISHLDGSGIAKVSSDKASSIQLIDNRLYYRNGYDDNNIYVIDLIEGVRSALIGSTLTDGGIHFTTMENTEAKAFTKSYGEKILDLSDERSMNERYGEELTSPLLFAEVGSDGTTIQFHRLIKQPFSPDDVGALVVISYKDTILGRYTDGGLAYRRDTVLTLFHPEHDNPYLSWVVQGRPPSEIKSGEGDRYGIPVSWHQKALELIELIESHM